MEKLIEKYNKECDITSRLANRIWKIGHIILFIILFFITLFKETLICILTLLIGVSSLYLLCEVISIKHIKKKLGLKKVALLKNNAKHKKTAYQELDKYQKDWITNYCKRNNLNSIEKLKLLKDELKQRREDINIKYLNPVIIGTLLIAIWEKGVEKVVERLGFIYAILPLILLSIIISLILGLSSKNCKEQKQYMNSFSEYAGYKRLEQLLLYQILKSNK